MTETNEKRDHDIPEKKVLGVIIATLNGIPLVSVKVDEKDEKINEHLIAPFFSALSTYSEENLASLNETLIKGGKVETLIVKKHGLILIALMDKNMKKVKIAVEAEEALDLFYEMFKNELKNFDKTCINLDIFDKFKMLLKKQIDEYYQKIEKDSGFFSRLLNLFRDKQGELR
jgi:hypothetical protein